MANRKMHIRVGVQRRAILFCGNETHEEDYSPHRSEWQLRTLEPNYNEEDYHKTCVEKARAFTHRKGSAVGDPTEHSQAERNTGLSGMSDVDMPRADRVNQSAIEDAELRAYAEIQEAAQPASDDNANGLDVTGQGEGADGTNDSTE